MRELGAELNSSCRRTRGVGCKKLRTIQTWRADDLGAEMPQARSLVPQLDEAVAIAIQETAAGPV